MTRYDDNRTMGEAQARLTGSGLTLAADIALANSERKTIDGNGN